MDAEECDDEHRINVEKIEDEYYVTVDHPMTKDHYISFLAAVYAEAVTGFIVLKTKLTVY